MMSQFSSPIHAFLKETNDQMKNKLLSKLSSIVSHSHLSLQYIVIITRQQGLGGSVTPGIKRLHLEPMETDF